MLSAKEMFESLGYELIKYENSNITHIIYEKHYASNNSKTQIIFFNNCFYANLLRFDNNKK